MTFIYFVKYSNNTQRQLCISTHTHPFLKTLRVNARVLSGKVDEHRERVGVSPKRPLTQKKKLQCFRVLSRRVIQQSQRKFSSNSLRSLISSELIAAKSEDEEMTSLMNEEMSRSDRDGGRTVEHVRVESQYEDEHIEVRVMWRMWMHPLMLMCRSILKVMIGPRMRLKCGSGESEGGNGVSPCTSQQQ